MAGIPGRAAMLALSLLPMMIGMPAARALDLDLFADPARACAYLATAGADDIAMVEIALTVLQREAAGESRLSLARDDLERLGGDARTIDKAIAVIDEQIVQGHASLRALRARLRLLDGRSEGQVAQRRAVQAEIRAVSEELIEISFNLRDAKARLGTVRAAMAGQRDSAQLIEAAQTTARVSSGTIRACAAARRASLAASAALPSTACDMLWP